MFLVDGVCNRDLEPGMTAGVAWTTIARDGIDGYGRTILQLLGICACAGAICRITRKP